MPCNAIPKATIQAPRTHNTTFARPDNGEGRVPRNPAVSQSTKYGDKIVLLGKDTK
ncbi:hypothetical protein GJ744_000218 [Endocarpon pusillum]|uniref:Uncharacterized protein n=1 Tax=Endocarpon pusillum TaxID=364733 RepID=A0A8H7ASA6_9EURO|nr:hypothetical protein GJ744_000218 [Endocarpon pusillum]